MNKALRVPDPLGHTYSATGRIECHTADLSEPGVWFSELIRAAVIRHLHIPRVAAA